MYLHYLIVSSAGSEVVLPLFFRLFYSYAFSPLENPKISAILNFECRSHLAFLSGNIIINTGSKYNTGYKYNNITARTYQYNIPELALNAVLITIFLIKLLIRHSGNS